VHARVAEPSPFFEAWREALRTAGRLGPALDLACGRGRHALAAAELGLPCIGIDRSREALASLRAAARPSAARVLGLCADLESGRGIPVRPGTCGAVLVFCFLFRPLAPSIAECLRPGGLLLYETFTVRQRELGRGPRNPAFLLEEGELLRLFPRLEVLAYEEGLRDGDAPSWLASLAARKPER
jgi:SAM-dependent methyltransferase